MNARGKGDLFNDEVRVPYLFRESILQRDTDEEGNSMLERFLVGTNIGIQECSHHESELSI